MLRFAIILAAVAVCHAQLSYRYELYTYSTGATATVITSATETLPDVFDPEHQTIILIHGHGGGPGARFNSLIRAEIFDHQREHNVIVVDWQTAASGSYSSALSYVQSVANDLTSLLRRFAPPIDAGFDDVIKRTEERENGGNDNGGNDNGGNDNGGNDNGGTGPTSESTLNPTTPEPERYVLMEKVHLVGFGLGAHIAGIAGRQLRATAGRTLTVARITGLDPSGSQWNSNSARLREGDANYVEVIHTDGSGLLAHGIGTNIGHVNFHANGGSNQPGCFSHTCSHERAYELFAATMRGSSKLDGFACSSTTQLNLNLCKGARLPMGGVELSKSIANRVYRVNTGRSFPFL